MEVLIRPLVHNFLSDVGEEKRVDCWGLGFSDRQGICGFVRGVLVIRDDRFLIVNNGVCCSAISFLGGAAPNGIQIMAGV